MQDQTASQPQAAQLFYGSLIATAMVYGAGALIFVFISYFGAQSGGWMGVAKAVMMAAFFGTVAAAALGFLVIAPLGTALGLLMLRFTTPGWWQGALTGALVAIALEAFLVLVVSQEALRWEWGNVVTLSLPIILAMFAGTYVQHKILRWPNAPSLSA